MSGAACATTRPQACSYHVHRPITLDGQIVWAGFLADAWRIRVGGMGAVLGVDVDRPLAKAIQSGVPAAVAGDLIAACEAGFVTAANERDEHGSQEP